MDHREVRADDEVAKHSRSEQSRINGAKGRGPVTVGGKAVVSQNARKHGLSARATVVVREEEEEEFETYRTSLIETLQPADDMQSMLVEMIVQCGWRLRTFVGIETDFMRDNLEKGGRDHHAFTLYGMHDRFAILSRYQANIERSMYRAMADLRRRQEKHGKPENGK